jgi:hypothetical protein
MKHGVGLPPEERGHETMAKVVDELIGYAAVDSGQLLITDPAYVYGHSISIPRTKESAQISFSLPGSAGGRPAAVLVSGEMGQGTCSVHTIRRKKTGELLAIVIGVAENGDAEQ